MVMLKHRWMGCRYIFDRKHINTSIAFLERYNALVGICFIAMLLFRSAVITNAKLHEANYFSVVGDIETTRGRLLHPVVVPHDNTRVLFVLTIIVILILTSMLTTTDFSTI